MIRRTPIAADLLSTAATIPTGLTSDYKADERILSPIPGVVMQVFVKAGDKVAAGDALLVIEAMKMKNTLRSGQTLEVADVYIHSGQVVKAGEILVEFKKSNKGS